MNPIALLDQTIDQLMPSITMKVTKLEISVALITAGILAVAGVAIRLVNKLQSRYSGPRSFYWSAPDECEFLDRFRIQGGDAGSCWENVSERIEVPL